MTKFSFEDKLRAVNMYLRGYGSNTVAKVYKSEESLKYPYVGQTISKIWY